MTNNHVLGSAAEAATSLAEFNYQDGIQTPTVFELDPASFFLTDPALDYTLVAVRPRGTGRAEVKSFGFNRLIEQQGKILIGEALNIIQHPNGETGRSGADSKIDGRTGSGHDWCAALRRWLQPYRFALRNSLRNLPCGSH